MKNDARTLKMQNIIYDSLSAMWFIIAGLQYRDSGRLGYVLPAVFCGAVWMGMGSWARRRRSGQDK